MNIYSKLKVKMASIKFNSMLKKYNLYFVTRHSYQNHKYRDSFIFDIRAINIVYLGGGMSLVKKN